MAKESKPVDTENTQPAVLVSTDRSDTVIKQVVNQHEEPAEWYADTIQFDEAYRSMFELPDPLKPGAPQHVRAKEYTYCWVEVDDERMLNLYLKEGWRPVNRTNHSFLPNRLFSTNGAIERRGYTTHVLFYQPRSFNEQKKLAAIRSSERRLETAKAQLDKSEGPIRFEEVTTSGGYGRTPDEAPVETDWQGNVVSPSDTD